MDLEPCTQGVWLQSVGLTLCLTLFLSKQHFVEHDKCLFLFASLFKVGFTGGENTGKAHIGELILPKGTQ